MSPRDPTGQGTARRGPSSESREGGGFEEVVGSQCRLRAGKRHGWVQKPQLWEATAGTVPGDREAGSCGGCLGECELWADGLEAERLRGGHAGFATGHHRCLCSIWAGVSRVGACGAGARR